VEITRADSVGVAELERAAALGWRAREEEPLGDWLLRASAGFTARANSVLAVGTPGLPLSEALTRVERWYAARDLPALVAVPLPLQEELHLDLLGRGWTPIRSALVLVGDLGALLARNPPASDLVSVEPHPGVGWLSLYGRGGGDLPAVPIDILTRGDVVGFASVIRDGEVLAIGRGAVAEGWAGVFAVEVAPRARRQGLAALVMRALLAWGNAEGARSAYLQVRPDNTPALALYERLGFVHHHRYVYLAAPT
jgi:N-acetylglutamate synthase